MRSGDHLTEHEDEMPFDGEDHLHRWEMPARPYSKPFTWRDVVPACLMIIGTIGAILAIALLLRFAAPRPIPAPDKIGAVAVEHVTKGGDDA
jgi:hypothetical protein